ncbi:putative metalloprotease CJM1_0395 family protein [Campylobacter armoricus]|uniref:SprA family protein n=1 Tax=Campylobacter armoricus TaxID=2505970 RepID=A0A7L5HIH2_9BACT|nr:putative metalloprotease CJM1_0395 family protein [Campylobacter armoricus]QKF79065.1 SprA family protein [Campylobacter armoricus]
MQINSNYNSVLYIQNPYKNKEKENNQENTNSEIQNSTEDKKNNNEEKTQKVNGKELSEEEVRQVRELEKIDREVKAHEAAHMAAGGALAGGASYGYTRGPDNRMYAIEGEVPIKMQKGNTPEETIANAMQIIAAAMAPADPSPQDYKVAANAMQMQNESRIEQAKKKAEELKAQNEKDTNENDKEYNTNSQAIKSYTQNSSQDYIGSQYNKSA